MRTADDGGGCIDCGGAGGAKKVAVEDGLGIRITKEPASRRMNSNDKNNNGLFLQAAHAIHIVSATGLYSRTRCIRMVCYLRLRTRGTLNMVCTSWEVGSSAGAPGCVAPSRLLQPTHASSS